MKRIRSKMQNYSLILKGIDGLIEAYSKAPATKQVEERKVNFQDVLKKGMLAIPDETPAQDSEGWIRTYQRDLESYQWRIDELTKYNGLVIIDKNSLKMIECTRERSYALSEEIIKRVKQKKVPEGYGHETLYLNIAKEACEVSRKSDEYLREITPYEGKKVLLVNGKVITLKKILNDDWKELRIRKPKS